ncbi:MAG: hypothetical protein ABSC19_14470 [Syntrophorhabdales bacterium]|jgi:hypothetical protein
MARRTKTHKPIQGGFVAMTWNMLNSKAYKALPASAAKVLPFFLGKVKEAYHPDDPARYDVTFPFSYGEGKKYGFGRSTFFKMLRDLTRYGFVDTKTKGGLRSKGGYASTLFRLSRRWEAFGTAGFSDGDWRRYYPEKNPVPKVDCISPESEPFDGQGRRVEAG